MAKRSRLSSIGSVFKVLTPSYYLRKAHRLAFLCLFFVVMLFIGVDRQNSFRERELLAMKLQDLEVEREKLESELTKVQQVSGEADGALGVNGLGAGKSESKFPRGGTKQQPLILGVTQRGSGITAKARKGGAEGGSRDGESGGTRAARKLLPEEKVKPLVMDKERSFDTEDAPAKESQEGGQSKEETKPLPKDPEEAKNEQRREAVRWGMIHAWGAYEQYAWGYDELQPQSKRGVNQFGGLGASIVDSLDTLYIMGLKDQFEKAKKWVFDNMDFNRNYDASVFETTIRMLGGLLSAYDVSGDEGFLKKAQELGDRLLPAWDTPLGLPWIYLNLASGKGYNAAWTGGSCILADSGTTTVEMIGLSQRTGDPKYAEKAERVIQQIATIFPEDGLVPLYISPDSGRATTSKISLGAMGDSFYEYLLKVWVQGGKTKPVQHYREMWDKSMQGMKALVQKSSPSGFTYLAERVNGQLIDKMDHLACFVPGMLVLGAEGPHAEEYLQLAKELARTCYEFYSRMPSKLSGEHYLFHQGSDLTVGHPYNIGRPETVESLMYLWRKTHDPIYREWGWNIWQAFEKQCRLPSGYTGLQDVSQDPPVKDDMMQSFFMAETLKYLYLLFSPDDVMPLDEWVFNTEAHPLKIISRAGEGEALWSKNGSTESKVQGKEEPKEVFSDR